MMTKERCFRNSIVFMPLNRNEEQAEAIFLKQM